ncbi:MAG: DUF805 domain-containing protein [Anaerobiospirillum succiniciproducens]|uniref:DUF805 domain-containing protein n=1 Tax=Anaerobiospirillum succiniciproducens TaxID=13335 RepID=UPI002354254F|nr:DUF805 domain-containing protein [Anaerobiospirillum succiniciproducens]MCI6864480.1 DUF805 domain-containing protein [Anaerobiospirillum succiniciproducens]MDO4676675.1 DUF805 domain-containing protein [Anaerobiospirillum succiniciproducens]MDY2798207.1 DUF805 domain-containing protein [Anaerobiospirillum succiniciproducens]
MYGLISAIKVCLKDKLFITGGRAGRAEFWWFTLFAVAVRVVFLPLNTIQYLGIIYSVINFIVFVGHYTVMVRRLHDTGRSGLHIGPMLVGLLVSFAGFVIVMPLAVTVGEIIAGLGALYVLVLCVLKGDAGDNLFGPPSPLPSKA